MTEHSKRGYIGTRLRNYFLTGLIICAPVAITVWLVRTFIDWADGWVKPYLPNFYNPDTYSPVAIPGFGLLVAIFVITFVGFMTANLVGRSIVNFAESLLNRTPLVRTIYKSTKQIFQTVLQEQSSSFKKAGLIEYPSPGIWSLVFIATDVKGEIASKFKERGMDMVAVFLPPTPIPTAGFLLFIPRDKIIPLDMSAEDAAKLLISGGLVTPDQKPLANAPLKIGQQKTEIPVS
ncbi:DUF502 domain-containing protein [Ensifer sp. ENS07]|jgi:uncharacterized membrane protein|uniref:DUF502 domain-containing protein n=1 Tax=Ensifer adhaerens TaxID=106592 RepID=A0A9Q9DAV5_ENSAD|nr:MULTISPECIES: DUF502 domain-containing protein [Ensifer]KSV69665.1 membrane protein [Sinorhizobium sp. GW3]OWZ92172.1 hypothetical protein B9J07_19795 [Sinorhizobium sp. LM21]ANK72371.1 hypothetical protein FA04_06855 [Ensifer adhaerens]KDP75528.1 membrane protein [Ensifer adhaerens]KQX21825.1 hypothetical protein ASD01_29395 [Ensifer sp. Root423]